LIET